MMEVRAICTWNPCRLRPADGGNGHSVWRYVVPIDQRSSLAPTTKMSQRRRGKAGNHFALGERPPMAEEGTERDKEPHFALAVVSSTEHGKSRRFLASSTGRH